MKFVRIYTTIFRICTIFVYRTKTVGVADGTSPRTLFFLAREENHHIVGRDTSIYTIHNVGYTAVSQNPKSHKKPNGRRERVV